MTTIRKLITAANRLINNIGAGEELSAEEMEISKDALNRMIDTWSNNKLNIFTYKQEIFPLEAGRGIYNLGPGGEWDVPRSMRVERMNLFLDLEVNPVGPGKYYLTSEIYPVYSQEDLDGTNRVNRFSVLDFGTAMLDASNSVVSATLETIFFPRYYTQPPEELDALDTEILSGTLVTIFFPIYYTQPPEELDAEQVNILSATLVQVFWPIDYSAIEELNANTTTITAGLLV